MSVKEVSGPQIPMSVANSPGQTPKSYYDRVKQYIPCANTTSLEPRAPRTYFSLAKQYLPTSIYLIAGIGTCVNAYNGDGVSALYYAGGGLACMLLHDTCLGGPPAPIITPQHIVDLENQQAANQRMLGAAAKEGSIIAKEEYVEKGTLKNDVSAVQRDNAALTHLIHTENENEKEENLLILGLENTLNANTEFLKKLSKV